MPLPSLSNLPKLAIEKIVEKSDWKSVLTLRQVCQRLRYQVDHASESSLPDSKLNLFRIAIESNQIQIQFAYPTDPSFIHQKYDQISYVLQKIGRFLRQYNQGKRVEFESEHLVDMAAKDLERILKFQKSTLSEFQLFFDNDMNQAFLSFPDAINDIPKSRNQTIKTEILDLYGYQSKHFLCMLPLLDPECLKRIDFHPPDETPIEFDWAEIVRIYPWITVKAVNCYNSGKVPVEIIAQFSSLRLFHEQIYTAQEMDYLITTFRKSSNFIAFNAYNRSIVPKIEVQEALWGPPMRDENHGNRWYFRMTNSNDILAVLYFDKCQIAINRRNLDRIPDGAVIRDN